MAAPTSTSRSRVMLEPKLSGECPRITKGQALSQEWARLKLDLVDVFHFMGDAKPWAWIKLGKKSSTDTMPPSPPNLGPQHQAHLMEKALGYDNVLGLRLTGPRA